MDPAFIRNFSIIAHIDHGKSTLADRLLEFTGALVAARNDGAGARLHGPGARARHHHQGPRRPPELQGRRRQDYQLNLIDTPGHVDFTYEVSRSLQACEGALLVVDASQGVEAQTLANTYLALHHNLEIIPVINKIDLPSAEPERIREQIEQVIGLDATRCRAGQRQAGHRHRRDPGSGRAPRAAAEGRPRSAAARADLRFLVRSVPRRDHPDARSSTAGCAWARRSGCGRTARLTKWRASAISRRKPIPCDELSAGEVGLPLRQHQDRFRRQDRRHHHRPRSNPASEPLPGFEEIKPMVFAGLYPVESHEHGLLRDALEKLRLNDSAFNFEPENSVALGFGFRCGFLGLLHLEIVQERLEREFNIDLITTAPGVRYRITTIERRSDRGRQSDQVPGPVRDQADRRADHRRDRDHARRVPRRHPEAARREARHRRRSSSTSAAAACMLVYELPLNEIVLDFYDRLKSASRGYASLDYHLAGLSRLADGEAGRAGGGRAGGRAVA